MQRLQRAGDFKEAPLGKATEFLCAASLGKNRSVAGKPRAKEDGGVWPGSLTPLHRLGNETTLGKRSGTPKNRNQKEGSRSQEGAAEGEHQPGGQSMR